MRETSRVVSQARRIAAIALSINQGPDTGFLLFTGFRAMTYDAGGLDQLKNRIFSSSESGNQNGTAALNQSEARPSVSDHQPARICIVEDDPVMLRMVGDYLEQHNMHAIAVSGRQEMARLFAAGEPDLVVLDLRLDQDDGLDLLREMRTRSDVPVIITTGDRRDEVDRVVGL